jgi:hypothetical protein
LDGFFSFFEEIFAGLREMAKWEILEGFNGLLFNGLCKRDFESSDLRCFSVFLLKSDSFLKLIFNLVFHKYVFIFTGICFKFTQIPLYINQQVINFY